MINIGISGKHYSEDFKLFFSEFLKCSVETISYSFEFPKLLHKDVVVFTGGADVTPLLYGTENWASQIDINRDLVDVYLLTCAINSGKKIIGVCRGHQLINAYLGGKLSQHLSGKVAHNNIHKLDYTAHFIDFNVVNSTHHQGVTSPGIDLEVIAYHNDIVEATRSFDRQILTMQFHPEFNSFPIESISGVQKLISEFIND